MPQVDLETLVSVCGGGSANDRKVACETLADNGDESDAVQDEPEPPVAGVQPDFPPESFWLSKDAEYDWFDRNAFFERKESTKGNSTNLNPSINPSSNSSSQRFSKSAIIGLPKTQKNNAVDTKRKCKPSNIRLFPKRSDSVVKAAVAEPSSPKVSCMGRVRSKRGRRRGSGRRMESAVEKKKNKKKGFCSGLISLFRSGRRRRNKPVSQISEPLEESRKSSAAGRPEREFAAAAGPPGLGGMNRFASGRRSESWSADVAGRDSVDLSRRGPGGST
ncbi:hypothetical protein RJ639_002092 [Escallonia herrerae]|uniref:Uncharacterized protein n=1 Tax=Escallonia herrerae TaxID=1293975 RepID=A0AA89BJI4_9ASTE|nr:hypothetical protein RJ639_002092 [Escallonia herrerae]